MLIQVNNHFTIVINGYFYFAARDPELVKRIGAATALEVRATGIQYVFAPCVAVSKCYQLLMLYYQIILRFKHCLILLKVDRSVEILDGVGVMKATIKILK